MWSIVDWRGANPLYNPPFPPPPHRGERGLATPTLVPRDEEEESAYNEHFKNEMEKVNNIFLSPSVVFLKVLFDKQYVSVSRLSGKLVMETLLLVF